MAYYNSVSREIFFFSSFHFYLIYNLFEKYEIVFSLRDGLFFEDPH